MFSQISHDPKARHGLFSDKRNALWCNMINVPLKM